MHAQLHVAVECILNFATEYFCAKFLEEMCLEVNQKLYVHYIIFATQCNINPDAAHAGSPHQHYDITATAV